MKQEERTAIAQEKIEQMCIRLFARQGIEQTSIDQIAKRAKLTKGAIYWHYASKEELVVAVLHRARETWMSVIPDGISELPDPADRLHRLFVNYLSFMTVHPDLTLFLQRIRLEEQSSIREIVREFYAESAKFIEGILDYGVQQKCFRAVPDPTRYSFHILSCFPGAHGQWLGDKTLDLAGLLLDAETDIFQRLTGRAAPAAEGRARKHAHNQ